MNVYIKWMIHLTYSLTMPLLLLVNLFLIEEC